MLFNPLILLLPLLLLLAGPVAAHNELLPAYGKACFYEDLKSGDQLAVSFQIGDRNAQSADQQEADFEILDGSKNRVRYLRRVPSGDVRVDIQVPGRYTYCFINDFSGMSTKDVTFHVHGIVYVDNDSVEPRSLDAEIKALAQSVQDIKNEQGYLVIRERTHRNTAESTNSRVKWWSIFQIIVVAINSVFQIYYLKRFFEVKTNV